ncbi:TRAP transporter substrate-binding protein [Puniceibacterium sp. IMCC21224]|uniref:TRAP transporter substrate-binding protein n=1 Tax=Puniceibacterium sp. IMCC21224 TaxID=1618204 RepID=UPI00065D7831|nr:TRAP transporter substrate-binding protein [Puniceibacterium sp. IMCC21224]KMK65052.1 TRAP-type C4-dicarboxylate transport system, periplasmic component [Puniceibacterium sp. IMCC21224]
MKRSIIACLMSATALVGAPMAAQAADIAIALHVDPTHLMFDVGRKMKELVEERSGGDYTVTLLGTEVGGERDQLEGASFGEYQITLGGSMPMTLYAPDYAASDLPFVYTSTDEARAVYEGELGEAINDAFIQNGQLRLVGLSKRNPRNLTANEPIETPDGVDGLRLRVPEIAPWVKIWSGIGASPSPIAWPEVYTSLQTGVIEAQENPVNFIHAGKLFEVQDYIMKTEHVFSFFHWLMNEQFYDSMSDEDREMVQGAIDEAIAWGDTRTDEMQSELYADLEANGMTVVEVDKDAFRAAATPAIREVADGFAPKVRDYVLSFID